jgi:4-oxalocrotonate tautomerase
MKHGRSIDQKRALVKGITNAVCEAIETSPEKVRIIITDIKPEDYGISGKLALGKLE